MLNGQFKPVLLTKLDKNNFLSVSTSKLNLSYVHSVSFSLHSTSHRVLPSISGIILLITSWTLLLRTVLYWPKRSNTSAQWGGHYILWGYDENKGPLKNVQDIKEIREIRLFLYLKGINLRDY